MKFKINSLLILLSLTSCFSLKQNKGEELSIKISSKLTPNSSIRAVTVDANKGIHFAGSNGFYAYSENLTKFSIDTLKYQGKPINSRAIAHNGTSVFVLSIENPALLYKSNNKGKSWELTYKEEGEKVFYDAMKFWNNKEGIAMGDPINGCFSIIKTIDSGKTWHKIKCSELPKIENGEAAYAASNGNIALQGDKVWIVSGGKKSRVLYSYNKGKTWEVSQTPITEGGKMTGIYAVDFYDEKNGFIIGGDWDKQSLNTQNKAFTKNAGKTWELIANGENPPYQSSVKYRPKSKGKTLFSVGMTGVFYSVNSGKTWKEISKESFYSIRFINANKAVLVGHHKIAELSIK